ncbi:hypothetical protein C1634_019625 [Chryseobacterium viscerum]|uniref:Uncharacterized protein n=1 Tax=Chryseobacterium viscerum TaxID=1037377 RepID=A0A316WEL5_9FLAO|nr:hypothetical protein C1634_019625 [Chryseobacterium viscerum]
MMREIQLKKNLPIVKLRPTKLRIFTENFIYILLLKIIIMKLTLDGQNGNSMHWKSRNEMRFVDLF